MTLQELINAGLLTPDKDCVMLHHKGRFFTGSLTPDGFISYNGASNPPPPPQHTHTHPTPPQVVLSQHFRTRRSETVVSALRWEITCESYACIRLGGRFKRVSAGMYMSTNMFVLIAPQDRGGRFYILDSVSRFCIPGLLNEG